LKNSVKEQMTEEEVEKEHEEWEQRSRCREQMMEEEHVRQAGAARCRMQKKQQGMTEAQPEENCNKDGEQMMEQEHVRQPAVWLMIFVLIQKGYTIVMIPTNKANKHLHGHFFAPQHCALLTAAGLKGLQTIHVQACYPHWPGWASI
jgi:hypothetical protein